jgi:hypothetical protein
MFGTEAIILHNGLSQKKLKEIHDAGFINAVTIIENGTTDSIAD